MRDLREDQGLESWSQPEVALLYVLGTQSLKPSYCCKCLKSLGRPSPGGAVLITVNTSVLMRRSWFTKQHLETKEGFGYHTQMNGSLSLCV